MGSAQRAGNLRVGAGIEPCLFSSRWLATFIIREPVAGIDGTRGTDKTLDTISPRFKNAPWRHVLTANSVTIFALALK